MNFTSGAWSKSFKLNYFSCFPIRERGTAISWIPLTIIIRWIYRYWYVMTSKIYCQVKKTRYRKLWICLYKQMKKNKQLCVEQFQKDMWETGISCLWGGVLKDQSEMNWIFIFIYMLLYYLNALLIIIFLSLSTSLKRFKTTEVSWTI